VAWDDGAYGHVIWVAVHLGRFAFFIEVIFVGIHLYGWDQLGRVRTHTVVLPTGCR
jgi:cytochrome bd-type quinol oxidase subunit 1